MDRGTNLGMVAPQHAHAQLNCKEVGNENDHLEI